MSIRILGGRAKGIDLALPPNSITRPTSVMLKRKLFDAYQSLENCTFVDLCAGSGSMGFEALSRGASEVYFVENSQKAFQTIKNNLQKLKKISQLGNTFLFKQDFHKWIEKSFLEALVHRENCFVFFDPPYEKIELYHDIFTFLKDNQFKGILVFEACQQKSFSLEKCTELYGHPRKVYKQGTSFFALFDFDPV